MNIIKTHSTIAFVLLLLGNACGTTPSQTPPLPKQENTQASVPATNEIAKSVDQNRKRPSPSSKQAEMPDEPISHADPSQEMLLQSELSIAPGLPDQYTSGQRAPTYKHYQRHRSMPNPVIQEAQRETYQVFQNNGVKLVDEEPVSTFSIDVDTGSYTNTRRMLMQGMLPPKDAVRIEEFVNYFNYDYPAASNMETPFSVKQEIAVTPWNPDSYLLHIGLRAYEESVQEMAANNLVLLIDVSGSMRAANKLGLIKNALRHLVSRLRKQDSLSIVVYAGAARVVLKPTPGDQKATIMHAIESLNADGSTHGSAGIELAYQQADTAFNKQGNNRILLLTDGDFNVGRRNVSELITLIEEKRTSGVSLSTYGFGSGNLNDHIAEQLADKGNGNYRYIDTMKEAHKVFVAELTGSLRNVAKDVKVQIEFNPAIVESYRLVGYVNRALKRQDFNNDRVDAGDIGPGHTVTAIYELTFKGGNKPVVDPLRYQRETVANGSAASEIAFLKLRYKPINSDSSKLLSYPVLRNSIKDDYQKTSHDFQFSASVAAFGQMLRGAENLNGFSYHDISRLAESSRGEDKNGYRAEFLQLVSIAESLSIRLTDAGN